MITPNKFARAIRFSATLVRLCFGLVALFSGLALAVIVVNLLAVKGVSAGVIPDLPGGGSTHIMSSVDPPCGTLDGVIIDSMEDTGNWEIGMGNGAIAATLTVVSGYNGQAIRLDYNLGITTGAYVQLKLVPTSTIDLSSGDHLRFFHQGTTTNTLEVGLVSDVGGNYFGSEWREATHVPWWTYATWDFQDFRKDDTEPFPDFSKVKEIFISVTKKDDGVGGIGSFTVDELQYLKVATRTVPSDFELVTVASTVTQQAATWTGDRQHSTSWLLQSWLEEYQQQMNDPAWLYDQALGLIVLSETDLPRANQLFTAMDNLQNLDGSWYVGYHYSATLTTTTWITTTKPVGANAWMVYALMSYYLRSGNPMAYQDALEGAAWLASLQRPDGSLPGEVGASPDNGAPTEANLDAWWAFQATGYLAQADELQTYLLQDVWDPLMKRFKSSGSMYPARDQYRIFLDNQTWGAAFLQAVDQDSYARDALSYARWTLATTSSNGSICGFDGAGPFSVWNEGTMQYISAHGENSQYYWEQMVGQQALDGGLPGSSDSFDGYTVWLTPWHGIAPTAWLYFAGTGGPFHITHRAFLPLITTSGANP